jgi:Protein kinase domain
VAASIDQDPVESNIIRPGAVVDGYELIERLGRGGMGLVFKARQPGTGQMVAVKLNRDGVFADQEALDRFEQEFQILGKMQPVKNIVPIYHVGHHDKEAYFVMQFMPGGSLNKQLKRYQNDRGNSVALVEKIARAVHQLHVQKILHRDIKPGNILLDADDEPFLSDFGLIKLLDDQQSLTRTSQLPGTPPYMAPEQTGLVFTPASAQTDVWALGVLLYELVVGFRPFDNQENETYPSALFRRIVSENPKAPRAAQPDLAPGLEAVILKCLEKNPADRFQSAEELADELGRWKRGEPLRTRPETRISRFFRRHLAAVVAAVCIAALSMVAAAVAVNLKSAAPPTADDHLRAIREELASTGQATIIPEAGAPRWHGLAIDNPVDVSVNHEGHWALDAWKLGLVELMRDVPVGSYKIRAEIRHVKSDRFGQVGLFVGHRSKSADTKALHFFCNLVYNDVVDSSANGQLPDRSAGNLAYLKYRLAFDAGRKEPTDIQRDWTKPIPFLPGGVRGLEWRTLEIEVRPYQLVGRFGRDTMEPLAIEDADKKFMAEWLKLRKNAPPADGVLDDPKDLRFTSDGSFGLVVYRGSVAVKNVSITRIPIPQ